MPPVTAIGQEKDKKNNEKDCGEGNDGGSKMIPINNPQY